MMSQCITPSWNLRHQKQVHSQGDETNRSSHVDFLDTHHHMSNFEVTELTWENGQLAMHELGGIVPPQTSTTLSLPKPIWEDGGVGDGGAGDTLESIVHQAAYCSKQSPIPMPVAVAQQQGVQNKKHVGSVVASCGAKWAENPRPLQKTGPKTPLRMVNKRLRSETERHGLLANDYESACANASASASAGAAVSVENNDTTMMTWSYESPRSSTRTKTNNDDDSACHGGSENQEEERDTKGETGRSYTTRKGRAAAVHNQSERRRRDRINQKMKALQKLVPNASKTDKASMLDEVIEYLKQLQAQLQMMNQVGFMPQMMMPLGMQQHLHQMSLLARMGVGANLGMLESPQLPHQIPTMMHPNQVAASASRFVPPPFVVPQMLASVQLTTNSDAGASSSAHLQDPYNTLLAQSMNIELCNRIAALQRQQQQQTPSQPTNNRSQPNNQVQPS